MGPVEAAIHRDLAAFPLALREGAIAATMLDLARQLDDPMAEISARDRAGYVREIRLAMVTLTDQAPGEVKGDQTDEVREARERRLRGIASGELLSHAVCCSIRQEEEAG